MNSVLILFAAWFQVSQVFAYPPTTKAVSPKVEFMPSTGVYLLHSSKHPVLAKVFGSYVYYSEENNHGFCRGKNVYRARILSSHGIGDHPHEEKLAELACVLSIEGSGKQVLVNFYSPEKNETALAVLGQESLIYQSPVGGHRLLFELDRYRNKTENFELVKNWAIKKLAETHSWASLLKRSSEGAGVVSPYLFVVEPVDSKLPAFYSLPVELSEIRLSDWDWDGVRYAYFAEEAKPDGSSFGKIFVYDLVESKIASIWGGEFPNQGDSNWTSKSFVGSQRWAIRKPRYLTAVEEGVLVAERTDFQNELRSVNYLSRTQQMAFRIQLGSPRDNLDVGGISIYKDGIVLSMPREKKVIWYGRISPFSKMEDPNADFKKKNK